VPFQQLVELLYSGDIDAHTPVSPHGEGYQFTPVREIEAFRVHLAKANAKMKVEAQSAEQKQRQRRRRLIWLVSVGVVSIAALIAGGGLAWYLAIHRPWEARIQLPESEIVDELPTISLASARPVEDELAYPGSIKPTRPKPPTTRTDPGSGRSTTGPVASLGKPQTQDEDDVQTERKWDQEAINRVVATQKKTLHHCLSEEAKGRRSDWSARVPIEFTIGNDGRVAKLWIDNPEFKSESSALYRCMLAEMNKWRFPAYQGEQANVSFAFNIRPR